MEPAVAQMRKGLLEYCVMALLNGRPRYGYELVQELAQVDGLLTSEGTMYPLLSRLRREGVVATEWQESSGGPPRKYYRLSASGKRALDGFRQEWATLRGAVDSILKGVGK
jgi:PadR family transcriptional regulator PadR